MKTKLLVLVAVVGALSGGAASAADWNVNSGSSATTASSAGATNAGNAQNINFNSRNDGTSTLKSAPALGGQSFYGSFSSDSCMVSAGGGGSVVGFAINAAVPVEDKACSLRRNFERTMQAAASTKDVDLSKRLQTAAIDMLCATNDATRQALANQGLCSGGLKGAEPTAARPTLDGLYVFTGG